jgi:hypothetical protein
MLQKWSLYPVKGAHSSSIRVGGTAKILGANTMTQSHLHTDDPQTLGVAVENLVATSTWRLAFVQLGIW